jgi:hypothetical protein
MANRNHCVSCASRQVVRRVFCVIVLMLAGYTEYAVAQTAASQTTPENKIEVGGGGVTDSSAKFGQYNGLQSQGSYVVGNFDFRGGAAYDSASTWRWRVYGVNLGLENRSVTTDFAKQGIFRFTFGYSEILYNRSDSYQTPYLGAGTDNLTLPANWIPPKVPQVNNNVNFRSFDPVAGTGSTYVAGVLTPPTSAQLTTLANIRAADLPAFQNLYLYSKRVKVDAGFTYNPSPHWDIPVSFSHEHKSGYKALGAVSSQVSEFAAILPDPLDQDHDQANASVNYKVKNLYLTFAYYGSFLTNYISTLTWQDVSDPTKSATMSSQPSNQFNKFSLTGLYVISPETKTKLVVNASYGRNTQNDPFVDPTTAQNGQLAFGLPATSLNGLVVTKAFNIKLTSKPTKKLNLSAAYKFDDRDNQTPVNLYLFQDANESRNTTSPFFAGLNGLPTNLGTNTNVYNNRAYSKQINKISLDGEYAVARRQWLRGGYEWQKVDYNCNGAWYNCAGAPTLKENTLRAEWRSNMLGDFSARLGYAYSWRRVPKYDENAFLALVPLADVVPNGGATVSAYTYLTETGLTGFGPIAGFPTTPLTGDASIFSPNNNIVPQASYGSRNNINELPGMRRYFEASRNRHKVRSSLTWQTTENFSLQGVGDFNYDDYIETTYGLRKGSTWATTVDATYTGAHDFVADLFYTYEFFRQVSSGDAYGSNSGTASQPGTQPSNTIVSGGCFNTVASKNRNAKIDPCLNWGKDNRDRVDSLGLVLDKKNMASGKLDLTGEFVYTRARTTTDVTGGSYVNNPLAAAPPAPPLPAGTPAIFFINAADYPTVRSDEIRVGPSATYALSTSTSLRAFYFFERLMASDYAYMGMQFGSGTNYLPTLETPPSYGVHVAGFSLTYKF